MKETYRLRDGKVVAGVTFLHDPITGVLYLVTEVRSGKLPTPIAWDADAGGRSSIGRCALYGGPLRSKGD